MFDIGGVELLVIAVVAILVVGPKELPGLLRGIGKFVKQARSMVSDVQGQFNEALREAELDEVSKTISDMRKLDPRTAVRDAVKKELGDVEKTVRDLDKPLDEEEIKAAQSEAVQDDEPPMPQHILDDDAVMSQPVAPAKPVEPQKAASTEAAKPKSDDSAPQPASAAQS